MVVRRLGSSRGSLILFCGVGLGGCLLPLAARGWRIGLLLLGMFLIGMCVVCANVIRSAWRQAYVPMSLMARTNTAAASVNFSLMPVAAVVAGWLAERAGIMTAVTVMGVIVAVVSFSCLLSPLRRCRDLPAEPPSHLLPATLDKPPPGRMCAEAGEASTPLKGVERHTQRRCHPPVQRPPVHGCGQRDQVLVAQLQLPLVRHDQRP